jgi:hypothetical protein
VNKKPAQVLAFKLTRNRTERSLAGKVDNLAGKSAKMAGKHEFWHVNEEKREVNRLKY